MGSEKHQDNLTAAYVDQCVVIRVEGRGSFKVSPSLKLFIHRLIDEKPSRRILIDMTECCSMDSTFMGVLAGLSYHLKESSGCSLKLINLSEKNEKLLTTLGVDRVVNYTRFPSSEEDEVMNRLGRTAESLESGTDTLTAAKTTLEAHENLVQINPDNFEKFKSVLELLQKDVQDLDR